MDTSSFLKWEQSTRDTIDLKKIYIDVVDDLVTGVLLSQIVYWHLPNKDGETKLRVKHKGDLWLAKGRTDWWDECRISPKQFDRSIKILEEKGIVNTILKKFNGSPTKHIKLNIDVLTQKINKLLEIDIQVEKKSTEADEKDLKIAELEKKIRELEGKLHNDSEEDEAAPDTPEGDPPEEPGEEPADPNKPNVEEFKKLPKEAIKLALYLRNKISANFPRQPIPDKTVDDSNNNLLDWCKDIDKLHRLGPPGGKEGYSWEEIITIIDWCQEDNFWKGNILSAGKLREKVITLTAQMKRDNNSPPKVSSSGTNENLSKEILELGKQMQEEMDRQNGGG